MSDVIDIEGRAERGAYNQALFREVNDRISELVSDPRLSLDFGTAAADPEWVCECANVGCMERLSMSLDDYADVRAAAARFLVGPSAGHVFGDIEDVVDRFANYWVVEKTGRARLTAETLYERGHG